MDRPTLTGLVQGRALASESESESEADGWQRVTVRGAGDGRVVIDENA